MTEEIKNTVLTEKTETNGNASCASGKNSMSCPAKKLTAKIIPAVLAFIIIISAAFLIKNSAGKTGWEIDKDLRLQFAYVPDRSVSYPQAEKPASLGYTKDYEPDIDNIVLANIKALEFNLPDRENAGRYKLYLKLFNFPESFNASEISVPVLKNFLMDKIPGAGKLSEFVSDRKNLAVKFAYIEAAGEKFSPENPFPPLIVGKGSETASDFSKDVRFYSIYLKPASFLKTETEDPDLAAKKSAEGVLAFHKNLLKTYRKHLKPAGMAGWDTDNYYFCADDGCTRVFKIAKTPSVFAGWRDLPMPAEPGRQFLSGLLLIKEMANENGTLYPLHVFEVGSVIRLKQPLSQEKEK